MAMGLHVNLKASFLIEPLILHMISLSSTLRCLLDMVVVSMFDREIRLIWQREDICYLEHQMHHLLFMIFNVPQTLREVVWLLSISLYYFSTSSTKMGINMPYQQPYGIQLTPVFLSQVHMITTSMFGIPIQLRYTYDPSIYCFK